MCLASVPQDVKYAPICYPRLALDSLSGEDLDAVAYFGALSHFPGFLLTLEGKKTKKRPAGFLLQISSGLCEYFPPRTAQKFLVWERPKSCTIRTFNIFLANDIRSIVFEGLFCLDREIRQRPLGWLLYFGQCSCWHVGPIKQWYK